MPRGGFGLIENETMKQCVRVLGGALLLGESSTLEECVEQVLKAARYPGMLEALQDVSIYFVDTCPGCVAAGLGVPCDESTHEPECLAVSAALGIPGGAYQYRLATEFNTCLSENSAINRRKVRAWPEQVKGETQ